MTAPTSLYERLLAFPIDDGTPALSFEARLARENDWGVAYARRVVREYKRFVYLAMTAGYPVTPSEQVDQAWHLHLTYSRSYWDRLCGGLLGRPLHHGPTRGGAEESVKFRDQYERTRAAYRAAFGEEPPADVWPPADARFGEDLHFVRVNTARNWVVPKSAVRRAAAVVVLAAIAAVCGAGCAGAAVNPFDLVGLDFIWFLIPLLLAAFALGLVWRARLRRTDPAPDSDYELDWAAAAYLSGGRHRLTTAAMARLAAAGLARVSDDGKALAQIGPRAPARLSPVEEAVLQLLPVARDDRAALRSLAKEVEATFTERAAGLRESGYLLSGVRAVASACAAVLPLLSVFVLIALPRLLLGLAGGKPVGVLVGTMFVAGLVGLVTFAVSLNRLTRRGRDALKRLRACADRDPAGLSGPESVGLAVAVFGTAVLVGCSSATLTALCAWYPHQSAAGGGSDGWTGCGVGCGTGGGDGSSGCGGGGCGGGCGGCGGCGG